jgi:predicted DNA-binding protein (MmcQ/YjbR family)
MPPAIRAVRAKLRDYALALPDAHEDLPWGERVVKVKNKVFVFLGRDLDLEHFAISVKLPTSRLSALRLPFTEPTGYGLGKSGWVSAKLDDRSQASFEMLRDWITESYCAIAPKSLAEGIGQAKAAKKARAKTARQTAAAGTRAVAARAPAKRTRKR